MFDRNVLFLLWQERPDHRSEWPQMLATWAGVPVERARGLLFGTVQPTERELERVADVTHVSDVELANADLLERVDLLGCNIRHLLSTLPHGAQQELARVIGVHKTTLSRWGRKQRPARARLDRFCASFGITRARIETEALFLDMAPISSQQKRQWVRDRIADLPEEDLSALFPAFEKLLEKK